MATTNTNFTAAQQAAIQQASLAAAKAANAKQAAASISPAQAALNNLQTYQPELYNSLSSSELASLTQQLTANPNLDVGQLANQMVSSDDATKAAATQQQTLTTVANNAYQTLISNPSSANLTAYQSAAKAAGITPQNITAIQNVITAQTAMANSPSQSTISAYQSAVKSADIIPNSTNLTNAQQSVLNQQYQAIQGAGNNVSQTQIDNYNSLAKQYGITPVNTSQAQNVVNQNAATAKAQAAFTLPTGTDNSTTNQTVTDPDGNSYSYVPANPSTGTSGQWYKETGNGYQAVNSNGTAETNAPVIPTQTFQQQLNSTQTAISTANQQAAQTAATTAFQSSAPEQAYQKALTAYNTAASQSNPDLTQLQTLYNNLNTAQAALQNSQYASGQYTSGAIQSQTGAVGTADQQLNTLQTQAAQAQQAQALAAQQAQQATQNQADYVKTAQQDVNTLNAGGLMGDTSGFTNVTQYLNAAQTAYNNALTAVNNNKSTDPAVANQLAQTLQQAATLNQNLNQDFASAVPQANQNLQTATQQLSSANSTAAQADKSLNASQIAASVAASQASRQQDSGMGDLWGVIGMVGLAMLTGGISGAAGAALDATTATDAATTAATMASDGATEADITDALSSQYGLSSADASSVASQTTSAVSNGVTNADLTNAGFNTTQAGDLTATTATPVAPTEGVSVQLPDGTTGTYNPTTGVTYNADGSVYDTGYTAPQTGPGIQTASTESTTTVTPGANGYNATGTTWTDAEGNTYPVQNGAIRFDITGTAGDTGVLPTGAAGDGTGGLSAVAPSTEITPVAGATSASQVTGVTVDAATQAAEAGLSTTQIAALGGGAAALAAVSSMGASGAAAAANQAIASGTASASTGAVTPTTATGATTTGAVAPTTSPTTTPLSPVQSTTIPPGTSTVTPVEATPTAPTGEAVDVSDATGTPVDSGGISPWWALAALPLVAGSTSTSVPSTGTGSWTVGTAPAVNVSGMNPGYLMGQGAIQPQLANAQGTQSNYYWGAERPEIMNASDVNQWNTQIPSSAAPWGVTEATNTPGQLNIQSLINQVLGQGQALSAYPTAAVPPTYPTVNTSNASINDVVNATLGLGQLASGASAPVAPVAPTATTS